MSHHDYMVGLEIEAMDPSFYGIIQAAMRKADTRNLGLLQEAWPGVYDELRTRYNAPGGLLPSEMPVEVDA